MTTRSSSESDDLPVASGRKRNGAAAVINVRSGDETEGNQTRIDGPRRSTRRVDVVNGSPHPQRESRPTPSPRVNARHFLLGASTGNAPVPRSCLQKPVAPTKLPKISRRQSVRRHTRSSLKAEQTVSPTKRRTRLITALEQHSRAAPVILDGNSNAGVDDNDSVDGVPLPSEVRTKAVQTSTKAVMIDSEDSQEDLVLSPKKKRGRNHPNVDSPTHATEENVKQQKDELEEDLENLRETGERHILARL